MSPNTQAVVCSAILQYDSVDVSERDRINRKQALTGGQGTDADLMGGDPGAGGAGKTNSDPSLGRRSGVQGVWGSVGCSCCIVLETSSDTANIFSYNATSLLHGVIQSAFVCVHQATADIKREDDQEDESLQTSQILLQARLRFSVPSYTLVTKEVEKLIHTHTHAYSTTSRIGIFVS